MASNAEITPRARVSRTRASRHEGFISHGNYRWMKVSAGLSLFVILVYALVDVQPRHNGGSWYGYTLGTIGAGLIVWLTCLGIRKRAITPGKWSLKAWTSAHVWLGLALIVIGTLHCAFQFGWNVHTLAYTLMMLVIISGIYGVVVYSTLPRELSNNRAEATQADMLENLRSLDRQLHEAAQPLSADQAAAVHGSLDDDPFGSGLYARLTAKYPNCRTRAALLSIRDVTDARARIGDDPLEKVDQLLTRKLAALSRVRRHLQIKALLDAWLYIHVPVTFALLAALVAHVISVFFYW